MSKRLYRRICTVNFLKTQMNTPKIKTGKIDCFSYNEEIIFFYFMHLECSLLRSSCIYMFIHDNIFCEIGYKVKFINKPFFLYNFFIHFSAKK